MSHHLSNTTNNDQDHPKIEIPEDQSPLSDTKTTPLDAKITYQSTTAQDTALKHTKTGITNEKVNGDLLDTTRDCDHVMTKKTPLKRTKTSRNSKPHSSIKRWNTRNIVTSPKQAASKVSDLLKRSATQYTSNSPDKHKRAKSSYKFVPPRTAQNIMPKINTIM